MLLIAAAAALGAAYAAGYFDTTEDPGPMVVATATATNVPVDTPTPVDAPTIAPVVDEPTEVVVTPTEVFKHPPKSRIPGHRVGRPGQLARERNRCDRAITETSGRRQLVSVARVARLP